jgi:hypothetical protein
MKLCIQWVYIRGSKTVEPALRGALLVLCGARVVCMRDVFILDEISVQDGRHFASFKNFAYHLVSVLAPNYKQHILSPAKVRKVYYS